MNWKAGGLVHAVLACAAGLTVAGGSAVHAEAARPKCLESDAFIVIARDSSEAAGQDIIARSRQANGKAGASDAGKGTGRAACVFRPAASDLRIARGDDNYWVMSLQGTLLVLDQSTGPSPRGLAVFDLAKGGKVWSASYDDQVAAPKVTADGITFWQYLHEAKPAECRDYKKIKAQSFTPAMIVETRLAFDGLRMTTSGAPRCVAEQ